MLDDHSGALGVKLASASLSHLTYLNFPIDPEAARIVLPADLEPALENGMAWVSWLGKHVRNLRVLGVSLSDYQDYAHLSAHVAVKKKHHAGIFRLKSWVPQPLTKRWFSKETIEVGPTRFSMHFEEGGRDGQGRPFSNAVVEYGANDIGWRVRTDGLPQPLNFDGQDLFFVDRKRIFSASGERVLDHLECFVWNASLDSANLPSLAISLPATPESVRVLKGFQVNWRT